MRERLPRGTATQHKTHNTLLSPLPRTPPARLPRPFSELVKDGVLAVTVEVLLARMAGETLEQPTAAAAAAAADATADTMRTTAYTTAICRRCSRRRAESSSLRGSLGSKATLGAADAARVHLVDVEVARGI